MFRTVFRFAGNVVFFGTPFLVICFGLLLISMNNVFGPLDPGNLDRPTLIRVMQLRDFRQMTPDQVAALADRAEVEFGRNGAMRPVFDFTPLEKKIYAYFRDKRSERKSFFESNLMLMARHRYFRWMDDFDTLPEADRTELMANVAADMKYWESVYMDFLRAAELPIPTMAELIQEFEKMIDGFKIDATPKEVARIDAFKRRMNATIVAGEVGGAVKNLSDNVSSAVSNAFGTFFSPPKKGKRQTKK